MQAKKSIVGKKAKTLNVNSKLPVPLLVFDGECILCNRSVRFILKRNRKHPFFFSARDTPAVTPLLDRLHPQAADSILLWDGQELHSRSSAVLRITRRLDRAWPLLYIFVLIPRPLRDGVYDWIARNRYRWFGRRSHCERPPEQWEHRFIDAKEMIRNEAE